MTNYTISGTLRNTSGHLMRNARVAVFTGRLTDAEESSLVAETYSADTSAPVPDGSFTIEFPLDHGATYSIAIEYPDGKSGHLVLDSLQIQRLIESRDATRLELAGGSIEDLYIDQVLKEIQAGNQPDESAFKNHEALAEATRMVAQTAQDVLFADSKVPWKTTSGVPDQYLWALIKDRSNRLGFTTYRDFIDSILCNDDTDTGDCSDTRTSVIRERLSTCSCSIQSTDAYHLLRAATEAFLMQECGRLCEFEDSLTGDRLLSDEEAEALRKQYLVEVSANGSTEHVLPYLALIRDRLSDLEIKSGLALGTTCYGILRSRIISPCFLELIWSYWHEQGMLVQTLNAVALRFQNRRLPNGRDPLARLALDPLRPLSNLLWGYIQDEGRRLSIARRAYEYDYEYGLRLDGKAIPKLRSAESRSQFIGAFHTLLNLAAAFFKEEDDLQVSADPFPLLNALRDLHLILAQGAHNQYGDLPWTSRVEMLVQQYLLARPELRDFLGGRPMVPYKEAWMDRVDTMKQMQGWNPVSITHFNDLAVYGEQLLLSVRFGNWSQIEDGDIARDWAITWRGEIQRYIYAYRVITSVDLSGDETRVRLAADHRLQPAVLIRRQLARSRSEGDGGPALTAAVPARTNGRS